MGWLKRVFSKVQFFCMEFLESEPSRNLSSVFFLTDKLLVWDFRRVNHIEILVTLLMKNTGRAELSVSVAVKVTAVKCQKFSFILKSQFFCMELRSLNYDFLLRKISQNQNPSLRTARKKYIIKFECN